MDARDLVVTALARLDEAGVRHCLRNGDLPSSVGGRDDVDVLVDPEHLRRCVDLLSEDGWLLWSAPGHPDHVFLLRCTAEGNWVKLDLVSGLRYGRRRRPVGSVLERRVRRGGLWVASERDAVEHAGHRAAGHRETVCLASRVRRALPNSLRRRHGVVVALVGPDGAGKGTVLHDLRTSIPVALTDVYLGTRAGGSSSETPPGGTGADTTTETPVSLRSCREVLFVVRKGLRLLPAASKVAAAVARGHVVVCDRYPVDALAVRPRRSPAAATVEKFIARSLVPRPDLLVVLDAPGEVLFDRKGEHDVSTLDRWRRGYLALPGGHVVDTSVSVESSTADVRRLVWQFAAGRRTAAGSPRTARAA